MVALLTGRNNTISLLRGMKSIFMQKLVAFFLLYQCGFHTNPFILFFDSLHIELYNILYFSSQRKCKLHFFHNIHVRHFKQPISSNKPFNLNSTCKLIYVLWDEMPFQSILCVLFLS